ncbi:MAG: sigma-70 family RNA polymerase sigma factor [Christensenellales bacterium]
MPQPLEEEEETRLLLLVKDGDIEARNTLIEHNLRLVIFIAKKFESTKINMEDLISIGSMGLIKGIQTFKMEKNIKLATYASRCIENEILMYLRKTQKSRQEYSLDEVLSIDSEGNEMILSDIIGSSEPLALTKLSEEEDIRNLYYALDRLSKREREIIIMRYGLFGVEPLTQKEVADKMGISQSYISRLEKRIIEKMRQDIEQLVKIA